MKQFPLLSILFLSTTTFSQNSEKANQYMETFSVSYLQIQKDMWDYTRSVSHGKSARKVDKRRKELIVTTNTALNKAKRKPGYEGSTRYKDSVVRYFEIIDIVLREDYGKIVNMEEISEQSYDLMEAYMTARELANDKMKDAGDMVGREQKTFAEANNINIIENESKLSQKMEVASQVYDHYNAVYLIFFKSYKQELYLLDAISKNDVSAIQQNKNALIETVEEGYLKLKEVKKYEGDVSMITATRQLLTFYKKEAEKNVEVMLDYLDKTQNFNKIKEAFDKIKEKNRTQEDVDLFNNSVNEMNEAVNKYNQLNDSSNKERGDLIDNWNKMAEKFTSKYVPRGK